MAWAAGVGGTEPLRTTAPGRQRDKSWSPTMTARCRTNPVSLIVALPTLAKLPPRGGSHICNVVHDRKIALCNVQVKGGIKFIHCESKIPNDSQEMSLQFAANPSHFCKNITWHHARRDESAMTEQEYSSPNRQWQGE